MRRYIPSLLLALAAFATFPLAGCDLIAKLKGGGDDAGAEAAAPEVDAAPAAAETADAAPTATTLPTAVPTTTTPAVRPVVVADAGAKTDAAAPVADAAAPVTDAGAPKDGGPIPTPTLKLPSGLLDGGLLRIDAGGFKPPWQR